MNTLVKRLSMGAALPVMAVARPASAADAQDPQTTATDVQNRSGLEDIVVTGRKRARSEALQQTPVSITALTSTQLERAVSRDLTDVGRMTPNASLQPSAQDRKSTRLNSSH